MVDPAVAALRGGPGRPRVVAVDPIEGGDAGGWIVAEGTPEQVAENPASYTGQFLRRVLRPAAATAAG